jgi:hypothetical protein
MRVPAQLGPALWHRSEDKVPLRKSQIANRKSHVVSDDATNKVAGNFPHIRRYRREQHPLWMEPRPQEIVNCLSWHPARFHGGMAIMHLHTYPWSN